MSKDRNLFRVGLAVVFLIVVVLACGPTPEAEAITVVITSPTSGSTVAVGQEALIDSTTTAEAGVAWVELAANGEVVRRDVPPEGNPTTFRMLQEWTPSAEGQVRISIVACDADGNVSQVALVTLQVVASGAAVPETPLPPVMEAGCTLDSQYVADVTIPDGTIMSPGAGFVKTWRIWNSGTCDWETGYELVYVSGEHMGGPASVSLPAVPAGGQTDISVNLAAPSSYGTHKGTWRIRSDEGMAFGTNLTVEIVVPAPVTDTPLPSDVPTSPPATGTMATQHVTEEITLNPGDTRGSTTVNCPADSIVVGGGYGASEGHSVPYTQIKSGDGWRVSANRGFYSFRVYGFAMCLSNAPGVSVTEVHNDVLVPAGEVRSVSASCPAGSVVTSGGWVTPQDGTMDVSASFKSGNGWEVRARNDADSSGPLRPVLQVRAVCLSGAGDSILQTASNTVSIDHYEGSASAYCEPGTLLVGGGFTTEGSLIVTYNGPSDGGWGLHAVTDDSDTSRSLTAYAVCLSLP